MMVGRELGDFYYKRELALGDVVLDVRDLEHHGSPEPLSLTLRAGEIVGLAGLVGAGRSDFLATLFGLRRQSGGEVLVDGRPVHVRTPRDAIAAGFALVPEDRKSAGLVANRSVRENIAMVENARVFPRFLVAVGQERALAQKYVTQLQIRTPDVETPVRMLSGGNQQKVVIGKWLGDAAEDLAARRTDPRYRRRRQVRSLPPDG